MSKENSKAETLGNLVKRYYRIDTSEKIEEFFAKVTIGNNKIFEIPHEKRREFTDFVEAAQAEISHKILQTQHEITVRIEDIFSQYWNKWNPALESVHFPADLPIGATVEMVEYSPASQLVPFPVSSSALAPEARLHDYVPQNELNSPFEEI